MSASDEVAPSTPPAEEAPADTPAFSAAYDRDSLMANVPEGVDKEGFGKYLDKTADPYAGFKSYSNIEKMKSKGLPNESWSDEDFATLNEARGVPKDADGYAFSEETTLDEASANFVKEHALANGHTSAQAQALADTMQQIRGAENDSKEAKVQEGTENMISFLQSEWGHPDTESYTNNFNLVSGVLEQEFGIKHGSDESDAFWSGNPKMVSVVHKYAEMLDASVIETLGGGDTTTPNSIQEKMDSLSAQMLHVDSRSQEGKDMDKRWNRLHAQLERANG